MYNILVKKIILFTLISLSSFALPKKVVLGTFLIPGYVQSSTKGEFVEIVKKIEKELGIEIEIRVLPAKRAVLSFNNGEIDGYFPSLDYYNEDLEINKTSAFYYKKDFLFHRIGDSPDIDNKKICLTSGYAYSKKILENKTLKFIYAKEQSKCLMMLSRKRVDGFISEGPSGLTALKRLSLRNIKMSSKLISSMDVYFAIKNGNEGQAIAKEFSKAINKLKEARELERIFSNANKDLKRKLSKTTMN